MREESGKNNSEIGGRRERGKGAIPMGPTAGERAECLIGAKKRSGKKRDVHTFYIAFPLSYMHIWRKKICWGGLDGKLL